MVRNDLKDLVKALPPSKKIKPIMRDSDIRFVLEKIASEVKLDVISKVNDPYCGMGGMRGMSSQRGDRNWDKIYTLGDLQVYVEAEIGTKKHHGFEKKIKYIVTPEQQKSYDGVVEFFGTNSIAGPLVDNEQDTKLKTIRIMSILAQYHGITLDGFGKEWNGFFENVRKSYGIEIDDKMGDVKEPSCVSPERGMKFPYNQEIRYQKTMVFQAEIKSKDDLGKICDVLNAGLIVQKKFEGETRRLSEHLVDFNPVSISPL